MKYGRTTTWICCRKMKGKQQIECHLMECNAPSLSWSFTESKHDRTTYNSSEQRDNNKIATEKSIMIHVNTKIRQNNYESTFHWRTIRWKEVTWFIWFNNYGHSEWFFCSMEGKWFSPRCHFNYEKEEFCPFMSSMFYTTVKR